MEVDPRLIPVLHAVQDYVHGSLSTPFSARRLAATTGRDEASVAEELAELQQAGCLALEKGGNYSLASPGKAYAHRA